MRAWPGPRRRLVASALVALAVVAGACTDEAAPTTATTSTTIPRPSTVLRVGAEDWPTCLNPLTCDRPVLHRQVLQHVLPQAFVLDSDGRYQPSPMLTAAPAPEQAEDGIEIAYRISPEARWADGRPITSSDFRGTWQAIMTTPATDRTGYDRIVDVDDTDPAVAVMTLSGPVVDWQELFGGASGYVLQADAFGPSTDLTGRFETELPFSAGPYLLTSWDADGAVLSATEPWEGADAPQIDEVRLDRVALDGLGDPMTFDMLLPSAGSAVDAPDGFEVRSTPSGRVLGLWFDQRHPILASLDQRKAVQRLLDRGGLAETAGVEPLVDCAGWAPSVGGWCDAAAAEWPVPDADAAAFVLFTLGWAPADDGTLTGAFGPFSVTVQYDPAVAGSSEAADEVAAALDGAGIAAATSERPTSEWASTRALDDSTDLGVFAVDLGVSPRVDTLYGCGGGAESSVVASCVPAIVDRARALSGRSGDEASRTVEAIGDAVAAEILWVPLGVVPERSFLRPGRVTVAAGNTVAGGPLAGLARFEADN